nr:hypothetical protein [Tanacetum cinerariifolium]
MQNSYHIGVIVTIYILIVTLGLVMVTLVVITFEDVVPLVTGGNAELIPHWSDSEQRTHEFMHVYLVFASVYVRIGLSFCDYHNMIAILEKYEHNVNFHQLVDFVEASHIGIETTDAETKILATVDGKPMTISESSIRRNLKLNDEAGISSLPDAEIFENLALMGYNILPNQKFTFQKDLCTRLQRQQTKMATKIRAQDLRISNLKARIKFLEDKDEGGVEPSREDATIKGRSLETREEAGVKKRTERGSNDTEELVNVLTSLDAAYILTSGVQ